MDLLIVAFGVFLGLVIYDVIAAFYITFVVRPDDEDDLTS